MFLKGNPARPVIKKLINCLSAGEKYFSWVDLKKDLLSFLNQSKTRSGET